MQTAFLVLGIFPPPPSRADILTGLDRARTRSAADRGISQIMQLIMRHFVLFNIIPNFVMGPVCDRVYLQYSIVSFVDFYFLYFRTRHRLLTTKTRDPGLKTL